MLLLLLCGTFINKIIAQNIAINETGNLPDTSAMLDVTSTTKGFLTPRMTTTERNNIILPATGLLIFNTTTVAFNVNTGTPASPVWTALSATGTNWSLTGNTGLNSGTNYIGTTDNVSVRFKSNGSERMILDSNGRLGVGTNAPTNLISLGGNAARTIAMERHTTANTAGNTLNIQAGSATSGATDKNGGDLYLKSGISTGTGSSNIYFQTDSAASSSGTSDNTLGTRMTIKGNGMVGLGTTNPVANWHLYGNSRSGFVPLNAGAGGGPEIGFGRGGFYKPGASIQFCDYDAYGGGLSFNVHKGTANGADGAFEDNWPVDVVQAMTIDNKGMVGFTTPYPTQIISLDGQVDRTIWMERNRTAATAGNDLTLQASGAYSTGSNLSGGNLYLSSGTATGTGSSNVYIQTSTAGASGTTDRTPDTKVTVLGNGYVGIGGADPLAQLQVNGAVVLNDLNTANITVDGQTVTVGNSSYLRLTSTSGTANQRTIVLTNGLDIGQILMIECTSNAIEIADNAGTNNTNTAGTRAMGVGDVITLIWNGTDWLETSFTNN